MNYSTDYTAYTREILMQKVQYENGEQRFKACLGCRTNSCCTCLEGMVARQKSSIAALTHDYAERTDRR